MAWVSFRGDVFELVLLPFAGCIFPIKLKSDAIAGNVFEYPVGVTDSPVNDRFEGFQHGESIRVIREKIELVLGIWAIGQEDGYGVKEVKEKEDGKSRDADRFPFGIGHDQFCLVQQQEGQYDGKHIKIAVISIEHDHHRDGSES